MTCNYLPLLSTSLTKSVADSKSKIHHARSLKSQITIPLTRALLTMVTDNMSDFQALLNLQALARRFFQKKMADAQILTFSPD